VAGQERGGGAGTGGKAFRLLCPPAADARPPNSAPRADLLATAGEAPGTARAGPEPRASPGGARPLGEGAASAGCFAPLPRPGLDTGSWQVRARGMPQEPSGTIPGTALPEEAGEEDFLGKPGVSLRRWGGRDTHTFQNSGKAGPGDELSDHVPRPRHHGWGWGRARGLDREGRSCTAVSLRSGSVQTPAGHRQHGLWGEHPRHYHPPPVQALPAAIQGHRIVEHPLGSTLGLAWPPPSQVLSGARRAPAPRGSIGWRAGDARPRLPASAPSPARAKQDAASEQRPRGSGPRPDRAPGQQGEAATRRALPIGPAPLPQGGGDPTSASPASQPAKLDAPSSRGGAPRPVPNTPSGARLTLGARRGRSKGGGWGRGGSEA
jgi:hypothetical protein